MTRREFLIATGLASAGAAFNAIGGWETAVNLVSRTELIGNEKMLFLDFDNDWRAADAMAKRVLGKKYVSLEKIVLEFGFDLLDQTKWRQILEKYPEAGMTWAFLMNNLSHGEKTMEAGRRTLTILGTRSDFEKVSLENLFDANSVKFSRTELTGFQADVSVLAKETGKLIKKNINLERVSVLNLSLQMGTTTVSMENFKKKIPRLEAISDGSGGFFVGRVAGAVMEKSGRVKLVDAQGGDLPNVSATQFTQIRKDWNKANWPAFWQKTPILDVHTAYQPDRVNDGITQLNELKNILGPSVLIAAAAGNFGEDLRTVEERFKSEPQIALVASYDRKLNRPTHFVLGADFYVDPSESMFGMRQISSIATPIVGACFLWLSHLGMNRKEIKKFVQKKWCDKVRFNVYSRDSLREEQLIGWVLNPRKMGSI